MVNTVATSRIRAKKACPNAGDGPITFETAAQPPVNAPATTPERVKRLAQRSRAKPKEIAPCTSCSAVEEAGKIFAEAKERASEVTDDIKRATAAEAERVLAEARKAASETGEQIKHAAAAEAERVLAEARNAAGQAADEIKHAAAAEAEKVLVEARNTAGEAADEIKRVAAAEAERVLAEARNAAGETAVEIRRAASAEAIKLTSEAAEKARQIVVEAECRVKAAAADEKNREISRILGDARKQAEKETNSIVSEAKKEAEAMKNKIGKDAAANAALAAGAIITQATEDASQTSLDSTALYLHTNEIMSATLEKATALVSRLEKEMQVGFAGMISDVSKAQGQFRKARSGRLARKFDIPDRAERMRRHQPLRGSFHLVITPSCQPDQVDGIRGFISGLPGVTVVGEGATEEHFSLSVKLSDPLPLLELLNERWPITRSKIRRECIDLRLKETESTESENAPGGDSAVNSVASPVSPAP